MSEEYSSNRLSINKSRNSGNDSILISDHAKSHKTLNLEGELSKNYRNISLDQTQGIKQVDTFVLTNTKYNQVTKFSPLSNNLKLSEGQKSIDQIKLNIEFNDEKEIDADKEMAHIKSPYEQEEFTSQQHAPEIYAKKNDDRAIRDCRKLFKQLQIYIKVFESQMRKFKKQVIQYTIQDQFTDLINIRCLQMKFEETRILAALSKNAQIRKQNIGMNIIEIKTKLALQNMVKQQLLSSKALRRQTIVNFSKAERGDTIQSSNISSIQASKISMKKEEKRRQYEENRINKFKDLIMKKQKLRLKQYTKVLIRAHEISCQDPNSHMLKDVNFGISSQINHTELSLGGSTILHDLANLTSSESSSSSDKETEGIKNDSDSYDLHSDDSYYEETAEDLHIAPLDFDEYDHKKIKVKRKMNYNDYNEEAQKLTKIFKTAEAINKTNILDRDVLPSFEFIQNLPLFKNIFDNLSKQQIRHCLEYIKIRLYQRGEVLCKHKQEAKYAYYILLGVVNLYEPRTFDDYDEMLYAKNSTLYKLLIDKMNSTKYMNESVKSFSSKRQNLIQNSFEKIIKQTFEGAIQQNSQQVLSSQDYQNVLRKSLILAQPVQRKETQITSQNQITTLQTISSQDNELITLEDEMIENIQIDNIVDVLAQYHINRCGFKQAGQMIGEIKQKRDEEYEFTAMCKTDCIILVIDQNIMQLLKKHKEKLQRDFAVETFSKYIPSMLRFYTSLRITEHIMKTLEDVNMQKGEFLIKEHQELEESPFFYLILSGKVEIIKNLRYLDQNGQVVYKQQKIIEVQQGDIVGEDALVYQRRSQYSAKVLSLECRMFKVNIAIFTKWFSKAVAGIKKQMDMRLQFMKDRFNSNKMGNEYGCLRYASQLPPSQLKNLQLFQARQFQNAQPLTNQKIQKLYLRQEDKRHKSPNEKKHLLSELMRQNNSISKVRQSFQTISVASPKQISIDQQLSAFANSKTSSTFETLNNNNKQFSPKQLLKQKALHQLHRKTQSMITVMQQASLYSDKSSSKANWFNQHKNSNQHNISFFSNNGPVNIYGVQKSPPRLEPSQSQSVTLSASRKGETIIIRNSSTISETQNEEDGNVNIQMSPTHETAEESLHNIQLILINPEIKVQPTNANRLITHNDVYSDNKELKKLVKSQSSRSLLRRQVQQKEEVQEMIKPLILTETKAQFFASNKKKLNKEKSEKQEKVKVKHNLDVPIFENRNTTQYSDNKELKHTIQIENEVMQQSGKLPEDMTNQAILESQTMEVVPADASPGRDFFANTGHLSSRPFQTNQNSHAQINIMPVYHIMNEGLKSKSSSFGLLNSQVHILPQPIVNSPQIKFHNRKYEIVANAAVDSVKIQPQLEQDQPGKENQMSVGQQQKVIKPKSQNQYYRKSVAPTNMPQMQAHSQHMNKRLKSQQISDSLKIKPEQSKQQLSPRSYTIQRVILQKAAQNMKRKKTFNDVIKKSQMQKALFYGVSQSQDYTVNHYAHKQFSTTANNEGGSIFKPMDLSTIMQKSGTAAANHDKAQSNQFQMNVHPYMVRQNMKNSNLPANKERSRIVLAPLVGQNSKPHSAGSIQNPLVEVVTTMHINPEQQQLDTSPGSQGPVEELKSKVNTLENWTKFLPKQAAHTKKNSFSFESCQQKYFNLPIAPDQDQSAKSNNPNSMRITSHKKDSIKSQMAQYTKSSREHSADVKSEEDPTLPQAGVEGPQNGNVFYQVYLV